MPTWHRGWNKAASWPDWHKVPSWAELAQMKKKVDGLTSAAAAKRPAKPAEATPQQRKKAAATTASPAPSLSPTASVTSAMESPEPAVDPDKVKAKLNRLKKLRAAAEDDDKEVIELLDKQIEAATALLTSQRPLHHQLAAAERELAEARRRVARNESHLERAKQSLERAVHCQEAAGQKLEAIRKNIAKGAAETDAAGAPTVQPLQEAVKVMAGMLQRLAEMAAQGGGSMTLDETVHAQMLGAAASAQSLVSGAGGSGSSALHVPLDHNQDGRQEDQQEDMDDIEAEQRALELGLAQANGGAEVQDEGPKPAKVPRRAMKPFSRVAQDPYQVVSVPPAAQASQELNVVAVQQMPAQPTFGYPHAIAMATPQQQAYWQQQAFAYQWKQIVKRAKQVRPPDAHRPELEAETPYLCQECGAAFKSESAVRLHRVRRHGWRTHMRAYVATSQCPACLQECHTRWRLVQHLQKAGIGCGLKILQHFPQLPECERAQADELDKRPGRLDRTYTASCRRAIRAQGPLPKWASGDGPADGPEAPPEAGDGVQDTGSGPPNPLG